MKNTIRYVSKFVVALAVLCIASVHNAMALTIGTITDGAGSARGLDQPVSLFGVNGTFNTITNVLLYVIGAIAVIMIVIGGLRYVLSGGNSEQVTAAKNTILYAIIGIIIAILAYAIIRFVIGNFTTPGSGTNL